MASFSLSIMSATQGEGMTLRDRAVQPAMKKPKTVQEMERSQLPAILGLQVLLFTKLRIPSQIVMA